METEQTPVAPAHDPQPAAEPAAAPAAEEPAVFQSDTTPVPVDDSWPACLDTPTSSFWDNCEFI